MLLILAGVTIATLMGDNGILTKTTEANLQTQIGEEKETINLAMQALLIDKVDNPNNYQGGIINSTQLKNEMDKSNPKPEDITMNETTNELTVKFDDSRNNRMYTVNQTGEIGEVVKREGIKVGDYVDYQYDEAEDYTLPDDIEWCTSDYDEENDKIASQEKDVKWRILKIYNDGRVDLISEREVSPGFGITKTRKGNGYNNAVFLINNMCERFYSNKSLGTIARSINLEDIESQMREEKVSEYRNSYDNGIASYGDVKAYTNYRYYPELYVQENGSGMGLELEGKSDEEIKDLLKKDGIGRSESLYKELTTESSSRKSNLVVTQTYYELKNIPKESFIDNNVYNILFNGEYWVASRFVNCVEESWGEYVEFGMYEAYQNTIAEPMATLFNSYQGGYTGNTPILNIRPIVTLNKDIKIIPCKGDNRYDNMHTISNN